MNCEPAGREYPGMNEQQIDIDMSHRGIHMQIGTRHDVDMWQQPASSGYNNQQMGISGS